MRKNIIAKKKQTACYKKSATGITLVSTVITIILLLILAGVTVSYTIGDNGIIARAQKASEEVAMSEAKEKMELVKQALLIDKYNNTGSSNKETAADKGVNDLVNSGIITEAEREEAEEILNNYQEEIKNNVDTTTDQYVDDLINSGIIPQEKEEEAKEVLKDYISEVTESSKEITDKYVEDLINSGLIEEAYIEEVEKILGEVQNGTKTPEEAVEELIQSGIITEAEKEEVKEILEDYKNEIDTNKETITDKYIEELIEKEIIPEENKETVKEKLEEYEKEVTEKNEETKDKYLDELVNSGIITEEEKEEAEKVLEDIKTETTNPTGGNLLEDYIEQLEKEGIIEEDLTVKNPDGTYEVTTSDGYIATVKPDPDNPENIIIEIEGKADALPVKIVNVNLTPETNYIDVNVTVKRGEGAKYSYYYKKAGEEYSVWKKDISGTSTRIEGLEQNVTYTIKVEATNENGTVSEEVTGRTIKIADLDESNTAFTYSVTEPTNGDVTVEIATSVEGYTLQYSTDGATWYDYIDPIPMSTNGTIYARLVDNTGQEGGAATGNVSSIDKIAPIAFTPIIETTTNSITVSGSTTDGEATTEYASSGISAYYFSKDDGATWISASGEEVATYSLRATPSGSYTFTNLAQNAEYKVRMKAVDEAGNEIITESQTVTTGKVADLDESNTVFTYSTTQPTKGDVTVTISTTVAGYTLQYSTNGTAFNDYTGPIPMSTNGTIYAKLVDSIGQEGGAATGNVANIDKLAPNSFTPTVTSTTNSATLSGSTTDATATAEYASSGISKYYFSKDNGATWLPENGQTSTSYTFSGLSQGTTYNFKMKAVDVAGNETIASASGGTGKVEDLTESNTTFSYSTTAPTKNDVTVTISTTVTGYTLQYSTNGTAFNDYTDPIPMSTNGTIYAKLVDSTGQEGGAATGNVANIDKLSPNAFTPTVTSTTNSATLSGSTTDATATAEYASSGISKYYFSKDNGATWLPENGQTSTSYTFSGLSQGTTYNFKMKAVDVAGNETIASASGGTGKVEDLTESNTTFTYSTTQPTKGDVTVTISTTVTGYTLQYSTNGTEFNDYTGPIPMSTNGTIYAKLVDSTGQEGGAATGNVANIDKLSPNAFTPTATSTSFSITMTGSTTDATATTENASSGISAYYFSKDNGVTWEPTAGQTGTSYTFTGLKASTSFSLKMKAVDKVGNETISAVVTKSTTAVAESTESNIDFEYSTTEWTNQNVNVAITTIVSEHTIQYSIDDGKTWTDYSTAVTMTANGVIYARLKDSAGNVSSSAATGNVTIIDKAVPTIGDFRGGEITSGTTMTISATQVSDTGGSGLKGYYINTSETTPTATSVTWTNNTSATISVSKEKGTYYIWVIDNAGNISAVKSCTVVQKVTSMSISVTSKTMVIGNTSTFTVNATASPTTANNTNITWSTSDSSVATISTTSTASGTNITVTAKAVGTATITARAADGSGKTATCTVTVQNSVAQIGTTHYGTLASAFTAAQAANTATITLTADTTLSAPATALSGDTITLALNSKTLTCSSYFLIQSGGKLNISGNGTMNSTGTYLFLNNGGTLTIPSGTYNKTAGNYLVLSQNSGTVDITGGTFTSSLGIAFYNKQSTMNYSTGSVTMSAGTYAFINNGGTLTINSGNISLTGKTVSAINSQGTSPQTYIKGGTISTSSSSSAWLMYLSTGTASITGGTFNFYGGGMRIGSDMIVSQSGGTFNNYSSTAWGIFVEGTFNFSGGYLYERSNNEVIINTIKSGGIMNVSGSAYMGGDSNNLSVHGTLKMTGGTLTNNGKAPVVTICETCPGTYSGTLSSSSVDKSSDLVHD